MKKRHKTKQCLSEINDNTSSITNGQRYIHTPITVPNLVSQSLGLNLLRHSTGKTRYPILAPTQQVLAEMEKRRARQK